MRINCSDEFIRTSDYYPEVADDTPLIVFLCIGSLLATITLVIYIEEIVFLYRTLKGNETKTRELATLLGLYPVICVMSVISLLVPTCTELVDFIIACYLSVCIYTFVHVTIGYFGGDEAMIEAVSEEKVQLNTPPCCCCCCCICRPITLTRRSLRKIKLLSTQVAVVRPILLFIGAILWTDGQYVQETNFSSAYIYISILTGISTILSMYGKTIIYRAARAHLTRYRIVLKFVTLQLAVVLLNLQNVIFNTLATYDVLGCTGSRGPKVRARNINHSVLIIESFLLSLLARKAYRVDETYQEQQNSSQLEAPTDTEKAAYTNEAVMED